MAKRGQTEFHEQCELFRYLSVHQPKYPIFQWIFAVPNGLFLSPKTAAKAKMQGVKAGIWDIVVPAVRIHADGSFTGALFIEMKIKPNRLTVHQAAFRCHAEREGYECIVCYDWLEAANAILDYLGITDKVLRDQIRVNESVPLIALRPKTRRQVAAIKTNGVDA